MFPMSQRKGLCDGANGSALRREMPMHMKIWAGNAAREVSPHGPREALSALPGAAAVLKS
jgi:hypothetical protein